MLSVASTNVLSSVSDLNEVDRFVSTGCPRVWSLKNSSSNTVILMYLPLNPFGLIKYATLDTTPV